MLLEPLKVIKIEDSVYICSLTKFAVSSFHSGMSLTFPRIPNNISMYPTSPGDSSISWPNILKDLSIFYNLKTACGSG